MMRRIILSLLLLFSSALFAKGNDILNDAIVITPLQINQFFNEESASDILILSDIIDKEEKVSSCVQEYVKKQSKSYTKIAQGNLYDLIHNFDSILSRIHGKKGLPNDTPYKEKLDALAQVQCEAYYKMGILK
jgi:hypothetical protein